MFWASRRRHDDARLLAPRMVLFVLGAGLGLAGMALEISWLVTAGIVVLAVGLALGLISRRRGSAPDPEE